MAHLSKSHKSDLHTLTPFSSPTRRFLAAVFIVHSALRVPRDAFCMVYGEKLFFSN